jgi:nicotinamide-nucleotide amidase
MQERAMRNKIETLVLAVGDKLHQKKMSFACAESCTGGGLAYYITGSPGVSSWFERGFVTYSNASKEEMLGVSSTSISKHGAVSEQVAREMAEGALKHSRAQVSVAITGIAGPEGGSLKKPVGTLWFAWASTEFATITKLFELSGDRGSIREQGIEIALVELLAFISA